MTAIIPTPKRLREAIRAVAAQARDHAERGDDDLANHFNVLLHALAARDAEIERLRTSKP
jgi:hypothetical protein